MSYLSSVVVPELRSDNFPENSLRRRYALVSSDTRRHLRSYSRRLSILRLSLHSIRFRPYAIRLRSDSRRSLFQHASSRSAYTWLRSCGADSWSGLSWYGRGAGSAGICCEDGQEDGEDVGCCGVESIVLEVWIPEWEVD